ncbi:MAG: hypothetical protein Q9223_005159 [Gallowayella weberi]
MPSSDEQDDEELQKAIALSLQTSQPSATATFSTLTQQAVGHDSDASTTDDEAPTVGSPLTTQARILAPALVAQTTGILGLDRKVMEQERLARKRKLSISPPPIRKSLKNCKSPSQPARIPSPCPAAEVWRPAPTCNLVYPNGAIKKTWAFGYQRDNDIKLEEVLQVSKLSGFFPSNLPDFGFN